MAERKSGLQTFVWVKTVGFQQVGRRTKPEPRLWERAPMGGRGAVEASVAASSGPEKLAEMAFAA